MQTIIKKNITPKLYFSTCSAYKVGKYEGKQSLSGSDVSFICKIMSCEPTLRYHNVDKQSLQMPQLPSSDYTL